MANNPYVNKVIYGNNTIMDISDTTAEAADVTSGKKFYDRSGAPTLGTGTGGNAEWGSIDGDIEDQTDLMEEFDKKYDVNDTAETDIADADYVPFYDTSASGKRKSLWSNIKTKLKAYFDGIYTLLTIVGTVESGTTASKAYAIGNHFIKDGYFCTATAAIAQGATFTLNTNYTRGSIADACKAVVASTGSYSDLIDEPINRSAASGNTTTSLCTRGEKYTWNNKQAAYKTLNYSGTTDSAGDLKISNDELKIFCVKISSPSTGTMPAGWAIYAQKTYLTFWNSSDHSQFRAGQAVSGTVYYYD